MAVSDYMVQYITTAEDISKEIENSSKEKIIEILKTFNKGLNDNKISSYEENLIIKLKRTPKIISMIKDLSPNTLLVGFKLLDKVSKKKLLDVALRLKEKNKCDLVVANDLSKINKNHHKAFIIRDKNNYIEVSNKEEIADKLTYEVFKMRGVLNV